MRTIYTKSVIDQDTENELWKSAHIVFDTCALLDFYYLTPTHQKIMSEILSFMTDRIWLPAQVAYEFNNNRLSAMHKPKNELYHDKEIQSNHFVDDIKAYIGQWEIEYYHPYIDSQKLNDIKNALVIIEPMIANIKTIIAKEYEERKREIDSIATNDILGEAVNKLQHGNESNYSFIKEIVREGAYRYANMIPPGYKDAETKAGVRQYGDLIIWKEIIQYAKTNKQNIIFITNDTKEDWCIENKKEVDKKDKLLYNPLPEEIGHPRRELLAEFEEESGQKIWFYKTTDFINRIEKLYHPKQEEIPFWGQLGVVRDVLERKEKERVVKQYRNGKAILIRCDVCGELFPFYVNDMDFEWEGGVIADRSMGPESQYIAHESCDCPNCKNQIDVILQVWEYPMGAFNCQNIDINGGEIEKTVDLSDLISFGDYEERDTYD